MKFNINNYVRVKLTPKGKDVLRARAKPIPKEDKYGWSRWQLWTLFEVFGNYVHVGSDAPFETEIEIETESVW
jgi:hypothetical protein